MFREIIKFLLSVIGFAFLMLMLLFSLNGLKIRIEPINPQNTEIERDSLNLNPSYITD